MEGNYPHGVGRQHGRTLDNGDDTNARISANGRYVVFAAYSRQLNDEAVFVRDLQTFDLITAPVSRARPGDQSTQQSRAGEYTTVPPQHRVDQCRPSRKSGPATALTQNGATASYHEASSACFVGCSRRNRPGAVPHARENARENAYSEV